MLTWKSARSQLQLIQVRNRCKKSFGYKTHLDYAEVFCEMYVHFYDSYWATHREMKFFSPPSSLNLYVFCIFKTKLSSKTGNGNDEQC